MILDFDELTSVAASPEDSTFELHFILQTLGVERYCKTQRESKAEFAVEQLSILTTMRNNCMCRDED